MKKLLFCIVILATAYTNSFANLTQGHWRWRNNNGTEKTATWKAGQDITVTISDYKAIRLRAEVYNTTGNTKTLDHGLQYATSPSGPWLNISNVSAINAFVFGGNNSYVSNGDSTTKQIADDAYTFFPGTIITQEDSNSDTILNNDRREYEWCIKPTSQIQPNTTYYFKSSAGGDQSILPSLTTAGNMFVAGPQAILPNGGFENDLNGWQTSTANGSAATFNITTATNYFHTGAKALAVTVTNNGASNSVTLSSGNVTLSDTGTYMLRFWAIAKQRNALLDIDLKGATTDNTCHYQIYDRFDTTKNGWQMYQYAFKVTESPVTLQMHFNTNTTYYLDDVEIINDVTNPNIDVKTQYVWQNNLNEDYGWLSGDNNNPLLLPDNRVAWVYNDSFMGVNDPHSNVLSSSHIVNNLVVTRSGDQLTSTYGGTAPNSQALFNPGNGNLFWQSGGIIENNSMKILLIEINNGNYAGHSWVGTLSLPDLKPVSLNKLPSTINVNPNCIIADGAYDYIYFGQSTGGFEVHSIVARVPAGQFDSQTPWQYYTGDTTWSTDYNKAKNIVQGVSAGNVVKLGPNNYVMSGVPNLASEVDAWFAPTPYGPWGNKTVIYNIPQQEGILAYEGHLDPTSRNGFYTFTYSVYPFVNESNGSSGSVAMQIADKTTYVPCYAKANLLQLSPYTSIKPADSLSSFTGKVVGQTVQLNWTSTQTTDDHYDVQRSTDGNTWQGIATVAGVDSVSLANYTYLDNNPVSGINYYRIALFDADSKLTYSKVIILSTLQTAVVTNFTATNRSPKVELDWSTSSELNNTGDFTVQKSTDGVNFTTLTTVKGGGTSDTPLNYSAFDPTPFDGTNYYRLSYQSNSKDTLSAVVSIKLPSDSLISFSGKDIDQKVQLNWAVANNNIDNFVIQHSTDGTTFTNLATVSGADSASYLNYQTIDNAPATGINYYRIEMHDIDGNVTLSAEITVNTTQNADLTSFTAMADGTTKVKLDWSTSSEQNNTLFTLERSTNGSTFTTLTTVTGAGTTTTSTNYESFDEDPFNGVNYYRLSYLSNGKDTTSVVRTVDMSQALALRVYPNPTHAAVQFNLLGYKGGSFNIILSNLAGRIVDKETFNVIDNGVYTLQNKPADGVYILKLTGKGLSKSSRVIVQ